MGTTITLVALGTFILAAALLCRSAGNTRRRSESIVATETYRIRGRDSYTIEYRHCVTTGIYHIFVLACPLSPQAEDLGLSRSGQVWTDAEPRTLAEAKKIARAWMESYSDRVRSDQSPTNELSRPAMLRHPTSRKSAINS